MQILYLCFSSRQANPNFTIYSVTLEYGEEILIQSQLTLNIRISGVEVSLAVFNYGQTDFF